MTSITRFENPPLVEVVAELRWSTQFDTLFAQTSQGAQVQIPAAMMTSFEPFYEAFAKHVSEYDFRASERLVPLGVPVMPGQPAFRFRRAPGESPLLQVGPGVFSANGVPPMYTHWGDFRETLRAGVHCLDSALPAPEASDSFTSSVRYVDAFDAQYWIEQGRGRFVDETLGFGTALPTAVRQVVDETKPKSAAHQMSLPLTDGSTLIVSVGEGDIDGREAVILEVVVSRQGVAVDVSSVLQAFEAHHKVIRDLFFAITAPVQSLMRPIETEGEVDNV